MLHPYFTDWTEADSGKLIRLFLAYLHNHPEQFDARGLGDLALIDFYRRTTKLNNFDYQALALVLAGNENLKREVFTKIKPVVGNYIELLIGFLQHLPGTSLANEKEELLASAFHRSLGGGLATPIPIETTNFPARETAFVVKPSQTVVGSSQESGFVDVLAKTRGFLEEAPLSTMPLSTPQNTTTSKELKKINIDMKNSNQAQTDKSTKTANIEASFVGGLPESEVYTANRLQPKAQPKGKNKTGKGQMDAQKSNPMLIGVKIAASTAAAGSILGLPILSQLLLR